MRDIDVVLTVLLVLFALRGFWRGFFRESFGFVALIVGLVCALQFAGAVADWLAARIEVADPPRTMIAFMGVFLVAHTSINLVGILLDRIASALLLRSVSRLTGAAFGAGKAAAVLAFVLLFFHLFPIAPQLDERIMRSQIARPLVNVAATVLRDQWQPASGEKPNA